MKFSGFPRGTQYTPVPSPLLGPLLEEIEDLAELKCTMRALWHLHRKKGYPRFVTARELLGDRVLQVGLRGLNGQPAEAVKHGITMAVRRGTLLAATIDLEAEPQDIYLLNDEAGRRALKAMEQGSISVKGYAPKGFPAEEPVGPRANIFSLYEENIGLLTPLLSEQMKDAEENYPWHWIEDAFKIAVSLNKRNWRYIEATLKRWAIEGKGDGESGRYPQKTPSKEGLVEYLRQRGRLPED